MSRQIRDLQATIDLLWNCHYHSQTKS